MKFSKAASLSSLVALATACSALKDPAEPYRRPYEGIDNFGPERSITSLPKGASSEVWLGRIKQSNGRYVADDGSYEVKVGNFGECVYAFKVNSRTGRLVSWRRASKPDAKKC